VPSHPPGPPLRVAAAPGNGFALVTFSTPVDTGNSPTVSYTVTSSTGKAVSISAADFAKYSFVRVPDLPNGRDVTFTVRAVNATGTSEPSLPSFPIEPSARQVQPPPPPVHVAALPGDHGEVSIHFQSPGIDHAEMDPSPITSYVVSAEPGGARFVLSGRNILTLQDGKHTTFKVISGLKPGTYTFKVAAVNEAGPGAPADTGAVTIR